MKNIAITFVLLGLSNTSFSYNDPYEQNEPYVERESELISPNFKESSFDYKTQEEANNKTSYCFKKTTEGVCEEIQEYMTKMHLSCLARSSSGLHATRT